MPPAKTLHDHVYDRTFRARRHHHLLAGPVVPMPKLAEIQAAYAAATSEPERRAIAVGFERTVRELDLEQEPDPVAARLEEILSMPPLPWELRSDKRSQQRYYRATKAAAILDAGGGVRTAAAELGVSASTVRRDLRWISRVQTSSSTASRASKRPSPAGMSRRSVCV